MKSLFRARKAKTVPQTGKLEQRWHAGKEPGIFGNGMLSHLLEDRNAWGIGEIGLERRVSHVVGGFEC